MRRMFRCLALAAVFSTSLSLKGYAAELAPKRSYLELGPKRAYLSIREIDDQRVTASIANVRGVPEESFLDLTEGYYLGFYYARDRKSGTSRLDRLIRVQIVEIESMQSIRLAVGSEAMKHLRPDGSLNLCRPFESTTQELRTLPDVIDMRFTDEAELDKLLSLHRSVVDMKLLALGLQNFHDVYGHFPPAVVFGPDGKPWHSWRVLLLPFLDEPNLYHAYDFKQPWDGPQNRELAQRAPDIFREEIRTGDDAGETHYLAITGDGTAFPTTGAKLGDDLKLNLAKTPGMASRDDFKDRAETTILIGPAPTDAHIPWTKPEDLVRREDLPPPGAKRGFGLPYAFGRQRTGAFCLATEGLGETGVALTDSLAARTFRGMLTIAGGESIDAGLLPRIGPLPPRPRDNHAVLEVGVTADGAVGRLFVKKPPENQQKP